MILSSKPVQRVCPLATILGSNVTLRSRGFSNSNSPNSPVKVFWLFPLRVLPRLARRLVLFIAQMIGHLGLERSFQNGFGQLFEQTTLPDDILGFLVVGQ